MIIAIDGLDGSGKESLTKGLLKREYSGITRIYRHEFPDYSIPSGQQIHAMLQIGTMAKIPDAIRPYMIGMLFAYNRAEHFRIWEATNKISILDNWISTLHIFDRYWASNILYQCIGMDMKTVINYMKMFKDIESNFNNPFPDLYLFLHHPYQVLRNRLNKRDSNDIYEQDSYQKAVYWFSETLINEMGRDTVRATSVMPFRYDGYIEGSVLDDIKSAPPIFREYTVDELCDDVISRIPIIKKSRCTPDSITVREGR